MSKIYNILTKIGIVVASLLFVISVYFLLKSSPEKYYSKASRQHKIAEKRYQKGDSEGAEAAYGKAEELRKTARELQ